MSDCGRRKPPTGETYCRQTTAGLARENDDRGSYAMDWLAIEIVTGVEQFAMLSEWKAGQ